MNSENNKNNNTTLTQICAIIGGVSGIFTIFNVINNIIQNPNQWEWAPIVISFLVTLGGWGFALYFYRKNKKNMLPTIENNLESDNKLLEVQSNIESKSDKIYLWFDDYIKSGEGHEYMKTIGNNEEQEFKIKQMRDNLNELREKHDSGYLESRLYYLYIFALLHGATRRVWAVSLGGEWIDSPEENEFLRMNFEVAKKHIEFERFFVISKSELKTFLSLEPVLKQIEFRNNFFKTYIAFKEDLDKVSPDLYRSLGQGFLAFDDFAVADDRFQNDVARGYIFTDQDICKDFSLKFSSLRDFSHPLDKEFLIQYKE